MKLFVQDAAKYLIGIAISILSTLELWVFWDFGYFGLAYFGLWVFKAWVLWAWVFWVWVFWGGTEKKSSESALFSADFLSSETLDFQR